MIVEPISIPAAIRKLALVCAGSVSVIGVLVLIGWAFHIQPLKSLNPAWVTMKPNTALGFVLAGIALALGIARPGRLWAARIAGVLVLLVALLACSTAIEFLVGRDLHLDQLLFPEDPHPVSTAIPGRMAFRTLALFLTFGVAILPWLFARARPSVHWFSQILSLAVALCALSSVATYLFGAGMSAYQVAATPMAYHTAACFVLLGAGLFLGDPEWAIARVFSRRDVGGMLARRMIPIVVVAPVIFGWFRYMGEAAGWYSTEQGAIGVAMLYVVLFSALVLTSAAAISRLEFRRSKAEELQERVFTMSQDLMCIADFKGYFLRVNPAFERALGYAAAELTGRPYLEFIHPDDRGKTSTEADRNAHDQKSLRFENRYLCKDGRAIYLSWSATPYPAEGLIFASARDITEEKTRTAEIQSLNERLAGKIEELGVAMREMEAFTYSVSHDLRAPLRHIDGYIELFRQQVGRSLDTKSERYLTTIETSARQMGCLIDGLLAFSRMGRAALNHARIDSEAMIEELLATYRSLPVATKVRWKIGTLPPVEADPLMLRQVWVNLIENSLKYSRGRPEPVIEIGGRIEAAEAVYFVRDNGVGFDPQYAHKLFGVFQRLHSIREFEGTGIGLANVQRIVTRHGGRVWAEGAVDAGATFYFSLPVQPVTGVPAKPEEVIAA